MGYDIHVRHSFLYYKIYPFLRKIPFTGTLSSKSNSQERNSVDKNILQNKGITGLEITPVAAEFILHPRVLFQHLKKELGYQGMNNTL